MQFGIANLGAAAGYGDEREKSPAISELFFEALR